MQLIATYITVVAAILLQLSREDTKVAAFTLQPTTGRSSTNDYSYITRTSLHAAESQPESSNEENNNGLDPNTLMDMDIVIFSMKSDLASKMQLGAIQEDATLAPLSAWTTECAFGNSIEFLVDEEDRWIDELDLDNVIIHALLGEDVMSYGSRQVGGGKGPGNPHGEESELVYYVDRTVLEEGSVDIVLKPDLEILW